MILLKRSFKILLLLASIAANSYGQNLYDLAHSKQYASFLEQSQQYKLAAMEFERLLFLEPENKNFRIHLIKSYRYSGQFSLGLSKINQWYPGFVQDTILYRENIKLNLLNKTCSEAMNSLNTQSLLLPGETRYYQLASFVLQKDWQGSIEIAEINQDESWPGFSELSAKVRKHEQIQFKKPGIALALSTIVPGLGKVYTRDWKDGLISLLFVAGNAFQAYRGFSKNGITSVYGWIFGTLSAGFYAGNLYGSWKSARDYNTRSEEALYHEIEHIIFDRF